MFQITVTELRWLETTDEIIDLCLHGKATAIIGDETFTYDATVSATALYLLRTLTEDHFYRSKHDHNQMLPCCGFSMYPNENMDCVHISGCPNGIDWSVIHIGDKVKIITETGKETIIDLENYKKTVYLFADEIENYYLKSIPKIPYDDESKFGHIAFWNEWHRRRK